MTGGLANRISFLMNLHGPSLTLDTLCSSGLNAVHLACSSLARGECNTAFAGGVNLMITPGILLLVPSLFSSFPSSSSSSVPLSRLDAVHLACFILVMTCFAGRARSLPFLFSLLSSPRSSFLSSPFHLFLLFPFLL